MLLLEDDLGDELHVELFARAKSWGTIEITDRVADHAESVGSSRGAVVIRRWALVAGIEVR